MYLLENKVLPRLHMKALKL